MSAPGSIAAWLRDFNDEERRKRVCDLGLLTGLKRSASNVIGPANFERGLILDRLVETRRPARVLEIGTGRGLGSLVIAAAGRRYGVALKVWTVDILGPSTRQTWAIERNGKTEELFASRDEIWGKELDPALTGVVTQLTGTTASVLPPLAKAGDKFDLIFIDAGHDLFSVVHDLSYSAQLLAPDGAILMDDFAPLEEFGLGTCIAVAQAREWFDTVEIIPSEGLVFGGERHPEAPRGMVLLTGLRKQNVRVDSSRLLWWRFAGKVLAACGSKRFFPLRG